MGYLLGRPGTAVVSRNVTATLPNPRQERQTDRQEGFRLPEITTLPIGETWLRVGVH
jgi:hypothetical protein